MEKIIGFFQKLHQNLSTHEESSLEYIPVDLQDVGEKEHVLVCLSPSPSNARIIRAASRMAKAFEASFTALYVETPQSNPANEEDRIRLQNHMNLAEISGAKIETVYGDNIAYQIAEFSRLSNVTKIVIGRSAMEKNYPWQGPSLTDRVIELTPNLEVHIIPDRDTQNRSKRKKSIRPHISFNWKECLICIGILFLASCLGLLMYEKGLNESNIVTTYLLSVVIISIITNGKIYGALASLATVFIFNFLFIDPKYTLIAYDEGYTITFIIMFVSGMIAGTLANRLKLFAAQSAQSAYRTRILLEANQELGKKQEQEQILQTLGNLLLRLSGRKIVIYPHDSNESILHFPNSNDSTQENEANQEENIRIIKWVMKNNKKAGAGTDTFSDAKDLYYALRVGDQNYGAVSIEIAGQPLDAYVNSMLLSIIGECSLVLDNLRNREEKEEANLRAQNERLRANLLRAISHDLRTPLTAIHGNANILIRNDERLNEEKKEHLYEAIYDDSIWLIQLVENLLAITKIEEGRMHLHLQLELLTDVIEEALNHVDSQKKNHIIQFKKTDSFTMTRIDPGLIVQLIVNIINNAIRYTQKGSTITISTEEKDNMVIMRISDNGPGIADHDKKHIFDMFYTANQQIIDGRRSLGMGLALCKSIVLAHKGSIWVEDTVPQGTTFVISLPAEEVQLSE
ncbi:MAG: DUF4118 domain-containing protein [Eubacteriales bacterium]|nr:DUF4118 domain-containing protein [Eubacteriales bacterium]